MFSSGACSTSFASGGSVGTHSIPRFVDCPNCPNCHERFNTKKRRSIHMNKTHSGAQCSVCSKPFYNKHRCAQHEQSKVHTPKSTKHSSPPKKSDVNKVPILRLTEHRSPPTILDVNKMARQFHDTHASQPDWFDAAFKTFHEVCNFLHQQLKEKDLMDRVDYVGSTYEGTAVKKSSDFDVQFIKIDKQVNVDSKTRAPAGFTVLQKGHCKLNAEKERNNFKGEIQKVLNDASFPDYEIMLRQHGPAIQVDVISKTNGENLTSIDIVPAKELADGTIYVAKAPKSLDLDKAQRDELWHESSSLTAKERLTTADRENGCRKEAYRNCKIIRNRENNLHITSYQIKSAFFKNLDEKPDSSYWTRDKLGERTVDIWKTLAKGFRDGYLQDWFYPQINLIKGTAPVAIQNTVNKIEKMVEKPELLFADPHNE